MNCAAISAVLRSSTLVKSYNSSQDRIISFERTKTNHDKLPRENNSLIRTRQITLRIICIDFQVVFFESNFREFGTLNAVCEEIIKLHIFVESRQEYFFKRSSCFAISLVWFVSHNMIFFSSQTQFFQENWRLLSLLSIFELLVK